MKIYLPLICLGFLGALACTPTVSEKQFQDPKRSFGPRYEDTNVRELGEPSGAFNFNQIVTLDGYYSMAETLRLAENLLGLKDPGGETDLGAGAGSRLLKKLRSLQGVRLMTPIEQTPYAQLAIAQTENSVMTELNKADLQIKESNLAVSNILDQVKAHYPWPSGSQKVDVAAQAIAEFVRQYADQLEKANLYQPVKSTLKSELETKRVWILGLGKRLSLAISEARKLAELTSFLTQTIQQEKITISKTLQETLNQGTEIAKDLESCDSPQAALTAIVDIWLALDDVQRATYIKPASADLYKLLNGKGKSALQCLKQPDCNGFIRDLMKQYFILPKLEAYGVAKICKELNDQSLDYSKTAIQEMAPELFHQIPDLIKTEIDRGFSEKRQQLAEIQRDFTGFANARMKIWSQKNLSGAGSIAAVDLGRLKLSLKNHEVKMKAVPFPTVSAESIGVGLSTSVLQLQQEMPIDQSQQLGVEVLNQLVALSGFYNRNNELIPAWAGPLEAGVPPLEVTQVLESKQPYAVTDSLQIEGFHLPIGAASPEINLSAVGQAELLRGISRIAGFFKDWNTTVYEKTLGLVRGRDLVPEFDLEELEKSIFPKSNLFALSMADAAVILKNLTKKFSQIFVVNLNNQLTWANDYDFKNGDSAVMAGAVNIVQGQRANLVESKSISRWILALCEFLKQTEGIENTKAKVLLEKNTAGVRPLDSLIEARQQLRLLLIGMGNFLSNQMIDQDGLVLSSMSLLDFKKNPGPPRTILDQVLAIRALIEAAQISKVEIYRVSAIEIYYKMNYHLYNPKIRFYSVGDQPQVMALPLALEIVRSLTDLKPFLPEVSQRQLSWILQPWYEGLKTLY